MAQLMNIKFDSTEQAKKVKSPGKQNINQSENPFREHLTRRQLHSTRTMEEQFGYLINLEITVSEFNSRRHVLHCSMKTYSDRNNSSSVYDYD